MELVIAIAILAVVFTSLYSAYSSTLDTTEAVERERDVEQAARLGLMRITDDLASLYSLEIEGDSEASPYSFEGQDAESLEEGGTVLEFATSGHLDFNMIFPSLRINRVWYALEKQPDNERYYRLIRGESPFAGLVAEGQETVVEVAENVEGLTLTFVDADGQTQSQWDSAAPESQGLLPRLVHIRLQLAGDRSRVFAATVAIPPISKKEEEG